MKTNKRQQKNKKKKNNNKWPHPTLIVIYSRFCGMFHCDIENYRDFESYCRIHSLFKLLIVSFPAYFSKTFKSCKVLKIFSKPCRVWKFLKHRPGWFPQVPKCLKDSNFLKVFDKFSKTFKSFRVLIKHCNVWKLFTTKPVGFPDLPNWNLSNTAMFKSKRLEHCNIF